MPAPLHVFVCTFQLHIVHYNSERYPDSKEAMSKEDGLVVLGILIEWSPGVTQWSVTRLSPFWLGLEASHFTVIKTKDCTQNHGIFNADMFELLYSIKFGEVVNPAYEKILSHLESVAFAGQEVTIPSFDVQSLFPSVLDEYFTYRGSLTTPPCFQSVHWIVLHQRVQISLSQITALQSQLFNTSVGASPRQPLSNNYRQTQPLNNREIKASFSFGWTIDFQKAMLDLLKTLATRSPQ
ncbi:carbonic anhydrase 14-like [Scyliorhinus torazame]|uniref:carbonic anhydrase 14-like n=1 Tax=Scyliorhinus torazame TaxID=75743 RepID=UPI003B5C037B